MLKTTAFAALLLIAMPPMALAGKYHLGKIATTEDIRARDITILPDGSGLPQGAGTAKEGRTIYAQQCAMCHGFKGEGSGAYPKLVGGRGTLRSANPTLTVGSYWPYATTLWDYIHRAMPPQNPGSLSAHDIYSLAAFILFMNGIIKENDEINAKTLPAVKMPNRDGFIPDPRPDIKVVKPKSPK